MPVRRCDDQSYTLLSNAAATGSAVAVKGGEYVFTVEGTVGGATLSLQMQTANGAWSDVSVFSASKVSTTTLPYAQTGISLPACNVRTAIAGGPPSAVYSYLHGLG